MEGGVATELCDARFMYGADWGSDNSIVFAGGGGLSLISSDGGKPEPLTKPDPKRDESGHRLPYRLPNGNAVLFSVMKGEGFVPPAVLHPRGRVVTLSASCVSLTYSAQSADIGTAHRCDPNGTIFSPA
jgi:hypothetical protein